MRRAVKPLVFGLCLLPAATLLANAFTGGLGVNPLETITHETGNWTLRFLLVTLAVTPFRRLSGWNAVIGFRRMLGLFAFFYAVLHFLTYVWFDQFFSWADIVKDVGKRPFITAGFGAFLLLIPLALTSTSGMIRRLGGRTWRMLHRLVYLAATLGVVHYWWLVKADVRKPLAYATILAALLGFRLAYAARGRRRRRPAAAVQEKGALRPPPRRRADVERRERSAG